MKYQARLERTVSYLKDGKLVTEKEGRMPGPGSICEDKKLGLWGHVIKVYEKGYEEIAIDVCYGPGLIKTYESTWWDLEFQDKDGI